MGEYVNARKTKWISHSHWISGHHGILGNEGTEILVKEGTKLIKLLSSSLLSVKKSSGVI